MKKSLVMLLLLVFTGIEFNGVAQAATPWLHVDGNKIKDPNGNVVVLRGVSLIDLGFLEDWQGGAFEMIDRLTDKTDDQGESPGWYTKVIRINITPADAAPTWPNRFDPDDDSFYNNLLRPIVDYCRTKDMYAIIDWHYVANTYEHVATTSEFWEYMAPRFSGDSHVLFELFNEPINDVNDDWIFNSNDTTDWLSVRTDMQTWIDIVRTYAPNNLILVAGAFYSQVIGPAASYPLTGNNIAMVSHIYPGHWLDSYWLPSYQNQITTCATVYPVMMTEWGFTSDPNYDDEYHLLIGTITNYGLPLHNFREQYGISNAAWVASHDWGPPMFYSDWTLRIGEGEMGGFVKDTLYLRRNDDQPSFGLIDFREYADFATQWRRTGCDAGNGFCEGADMDESGEVAWLDLKMWVDQWLKTGQSYLTGDLAPDAGDGIVNMADLRILADNWLAGL